MREQDRHHACGTRLGEWDETRGGRRDAYRAEQRRCRGCELLDAERDRLNSRDGSKRGMFVTLVRQGVGP